MRELTINLNLKAETPLYEQIYHYIKQDIQDQKILAGEKLPSSRALSRYLEVSRSTVDLAYGQLLSEGYVESIPCKGYYACQIEGLYHLKTGADRGESEPKTEEKRWKYDFTPNGIDLDGFPYGVWRKVTRNVLLDDRKELFQLGDPKGEWELRETISHIPDYQAEVCTAFARGNVGKAERLAQSDQFTELKSHLIHLLRHLRDMEIYELTEAVRSASEYKTEINDYLDLMALWFRDVLLFKATRQIDGLVFAEEINDISAQAQKSSYEGLERILKALEKAKVRLKANVNFELTMELLMLTIKEN